MTSNFVRGGEIDLRSDLQIGTKSLTLTLSSGVGSIEIPENCTVVGVKPDTSDDIRVGLEAPEADGTKTGDAALADLKKGMPVDPDVWTWFNIGYSDDTRVLYVKGGSSDVLQIVVT